MFKVSPGVLDQQLFDEALGQFTGAAKKLLVKVVVHGCAVGLFCLHRWSCLALAQCPARTRAKANTTATKELGRAAPDQHSTKTDSDPYKHTRTHTRTHTHTQTHTHTHTHTHHTNTQTTTTNMQTHWHTHCHTSSAHTHTIATLTLPTVDRQSDVYV